MDHSADTFMQDGDLKEAFKELEAMARSRNANEGVACLEGWSFDSEDERFDLMSELLGELSKAHDRQVASIRAALRTGESVPVIVELMQWDYESDVKELSQAWEKSGIDRVSRSLGKPPTPPASVIGSQPAASPRTTSPPATSEVVSSGAGEPDKNLVKDFLQASHNRDVAGMRGVLERWEPRSGLLFERAERRVEEMSKERDAALARLKAAESVSSLQAALFQWSFEEGCEEVVGAKQRLAGMDHSADTFMQDGDLKEAFKELEAMARSRNANEGVACLEGWSFDSEDERFDLMSEL
eukprot:CAMPEP_0204311298 /NCGR_PEP_ID=MMETSP0469-20131031/2259_1 /ASSEMBLY_ACC=CAM_ASM_000384 /TAXON_ID=2969 /ORGANISM="Oxyrrhis marina" /LENGTH=297 /DNA_ID=CAMNT_0051291231 /DNA_START=24 /DNA_END=913 /DNA_ORIENTATION=+